MTRAFPELQFRPATIADAQLLLQWRNDPATRKNSRNQAVISQDAHIAWLTERLHEIYIAEDNGSPVGTVRAEKGAEYTELSWTVAPHARGLGYGKAMVLTFVSDIIPNDRISATIEEGNLPSEAIATALGLTKAEPENSQDARRRFMRWR